MACNVCVGGEYLILDQRGAEWGYIKCPECLGSGLAADEEEAARDAHRDRARYDAAMSEMLSGRS